jgi:PAS domain S-box-containing protein
LQRVDERCYSAEEGLGSLRSSGMEKITSSSGLGTKRRSAPAERLALEVFHAPPDSLEEVCWIFDWDRGEHLLLSCAFEAVWGIKRKAADVSLKTWRDTVLPQDRPAADEWVERQRTFEPAEVRYRIRRPDSTIRWIRDRAFPIQPGKKGVRRTAGIASDITALVEAEERLRGRAMRPISRQLLHSRAKPVLDARAVELTQRECEVIKLICEGKSNKAVAAALGISTRTAEVHRAAMLRKLELSSIAQLVRYAIRNDMVEP